jgi:hypothetical protein
VESSFNCLKFFNYLKTFNCGEGSGGKHSFCLCLLGRVNLVQLSDTDDNQINLHYHKFLIKSDAKAFLAFSLFRHLSNQFRRSVGEGD